MKKLVAALVMCLLGVGSAFGQIVYFDDFNSGLRSDWTTGSRISWQPSGGVDNSPCVRVSYLGSGTGPHVLSRSIPGRHQELYFKFNFKISGFPSGGSKFLKVSANKDNQNYANTTWGINYNTGTLREVSFGAGRNLENDTQDIIRYDGTLRGNPGPVEIIQKSGEWSIPVNQWHTFEAHMRYNSDNQRDGFYKVWINGDLVLHATNVVNRNNANPLHFNWLMLGNYTNSNWITPWDLYYDNITLSTTRVTSTPSAPEGEPPPLIADPEWPEEPPALEEPPATEEPPAAEEPPTAEIPSPPKNLRLQR